MKFSSVATALCAFPLVLGGVLQAEVFRRTNHGSDSQHNGHNAVHGNTKEINGGMATVVVVLWVNNGGGAETQKMNEAVTVTVDHANKVAVPAATHTVVVGGEAGLQFTPDAISAPIGDSVVFVFHSQNHTVTQSTFDEPCKKMDGGFDSGFMPNKDNSVVPPPMMAMQITTDKPLWFYCKQKTPASHCTKGMVFSINATPEKSQGKFKDIALAQGATTPGAPSGAPGGPAASAPAKIAEPAVPAPVESSSAAPAAPAPTNGMAQGQGSGSGDACACSCLCGVAAFPAAEQGQGAFGGVPGVIPMSAMA